MGKLSSKEFVSGRNLAAVLMLLVTTPLAAEIYQWRDASGRVHLSDKKPPHLHAKEVSSTVEQVNTDSSGVEREKLGRLFKSETEAERLHRQRQEQSRQQRQIKRQKQCDKARKHLAVLQGPVYFSRADGSTYSISESERERRAAKMAQDIEAYCSP